jgi:pimeloyl-ACP methyl ester carboxylesterase
MRMVPSSAGCPRRRRSMERIISKDGTTISYDRCGSGRPLVLVHGISATSARWQAVVSGLAEHFTVYAVNRRGRGKSGDSGQYTIEREYEDLVAVIDSIGRPVNLLGHSYGGTIALEAALLTTNIRRLVLYEPSMLICRSIADAAAHIKRLETLLEENDRNGLVSLFLNRFVRTSSDEIDTMKASPAWSHRLEVAHTIPREMHAQGSRYCFEPERFRTLEVPTLLLVGDDSDDDLKAGAEMLQGVLPDSRLKGLPGQKHAAMETAPRLFLDEVLGFLNGPV